MTNRPSDSHHQVTEAIEQIAHIHGHLAKGEVCRAFRSLPVAASGTLGIVAAAVQPFVIQPGQSRQFLAYWIVVAVVCMLVAASEILWNYVSRASREMRHTTRMAATQLSPALLAGVAVTIVMGPQPALVLLLPGLWALLYGLGLFATRPFGPPAIGWVALGFFCAGTVMLLNPGTMGTLSGWRVGGVFGIGQLAVAGVLYWNLERNHGPQTA